MFKIVILVIISFFLPIMWFAVAAYVAYLMLTRKTRRDNIIFGEIRRLISLGKDSAVLDYLYYDAAKSFARDHGAYMSPFTNDPADNCLIVELNVDNHSYNVMVQRWSKNGTLLSIERNNKPLPKPMPTKKSKKDLDISSSSNLSVSETLEKLTVNIYRNYATQNDIAPTSETSDQEILDIVKLVSTNFIEVAENRGERIQAPYLMTINVHFLNVYELYGAEFLYQHLEYELSKYLSEGLRDNYKKDLGLV